MPSFLSLILWNIGWATALAVCVYGLGRLSAFQRRPALLHLLWFGVLLRLIIPSFVPIPILPSAASAVDAKSSSSDEISPVSSPIVTPSEQLEFFKEPDEERTSAPPTSIQFSATMWLLAVSLAGTTAWFVLCLLGTWRMVRLMKESQTAPEQLTKLARNVAAEMKITGMPRVLLVEGLATPSIWIGWQNATLLLPPRLLDSLDADQWSCVFAHELAHLSRRDHSFNLFAAGIVLLHWWNPVAWWAWRELRSQQEACCDAMALQNGARPRRLYAETLLKVVDSCNQVSLAPPLGLLGFGNHSVLTRRFEMIANSSVRPNIAASAKLLLAVGVCSFLSLPMKAAPPATVVAAARFGADAESSESKTKSDEKLVELVLTAQKENQKQYAKGWMDAEVEYLAGPNRTTAQVEVLWSPEGTYWKYSAKEVNGDNEYNRTGETIQTGERSIFYTPSGKLVQLTQTPVFSMHEELKIRPTERWFQVFDHIEVTRLLDPKVLPELLTKFEIEETDQYEILVVRHYKSGGNYSCRVSRAHGNNVVAMDTEQDGKPGVWRRCRFDWTQLATGEWYVKSLVQERSVEIKPGVIDSGKFVLKVKRYNPAPVIPANRFTMESLNLPAGTKIQEYGPDGKVFSERQQ